MRVLPPQSNCPPPLAFTSSPVIVVKYPTQIATEFISPLHLSDMSIECAKKSPHKLEWWNTVKCAEIQDGRQIIRIRIRIDVAKQPHILATNQSHQRIPRGQFTGGRKDQNPFKNHIPTKVDGFLVNWRPSWILRIRQSSTTPICGDFFLAILMTLLRNMLVKQILLQFVGSCPYLS